MQKMLEKEQKLGIRLYWLVGIARPSSWLNAVSHAEKVIRVAVSIIFIGVGMYLVALWIQS